MANGTQEEPIIFTSIFDKIQPGQIKSSILPQHESSYNFSGQGGLVILGKAKGSFVGDVPEVSLKGEDGAEYGLIYGGNDDQDNSGVLNYVSIRNVGSLTLAAVGSSTQIDKVEVYHQRGLTGIKILGGTVNLENIMVSSSTTGLSIDQGWNGTLENFYLGNCGRSIMVGGPKGSYYGGNHHIDKGSIFVSYVGAILNFEENSNTDLSKIFFQIIVLQSDEPFFYDGINYWVNLVPSIYKPEVSELVVYSYSPISSDIFLSWSDKVKIHGSPGEVLPNVGVNLDPFEKWSIIRDIVFKAPIYNGP